MSCEVRNFKWLRTGVERASCEVQNFKLLRTGVETASCEVHNFKVLRTGEDPTTLPSVVLAVVVDGLFGVFVGVSGAWDELFIGTRPPSPHSLLPFPHP